jgi:hypothetical protein
MWNGKVIVLPDADIVRKANQWQTDQCDDTICDDPNGAHAVRITGPREAHHDEGGEDIGRRDQAVSCSGAETHAVLQDDGQEVGDSVGHGSGKQEQGCEAPYLKVEGSLHVGVEIEVLGNDVVAIFFDSSNDKVDLRLSEEFLLRGGGLSSKLRKVDDEVPANQADRDCDDSLHDKDPAPSGKTWAEVRNDLWVLLGWSEVHAKPWSGLVAMALQEREEVAEDSRER